MKLVLASASPRRLDILRQLGLNPTAQRADVDERSLAGEGADALVQRLAGLKADTVADALPTDTDPDRTVVLGADTVVVLDGRIIGKPKDEADAVQTLLSLSGRTHEVKTGVVARRGAQRCVEVCTTEVRFGVIGDALAQRYWQTGEPADKAGSYAIQGQGTRFVESLVGDYSNVVGLPARTTVLMLEALGFPV